MTKSAELRVKQICAQAFRLKRCKHRVKINIKGLVLSFVSRLSISIDIDHHVSTAHSRSSSGDSVDLLSQTICTTLVVSDWCITNLAHGWVKFIDRFINWVKLSLLTETLTGTLVELERLFT